MSPPWTAMEFLGSRSFPGIDEGLPDLVWSSRTHLPYASSSPPRPHEVLPAYCQLHRYHVLRNIVAIALAEAGVRLSRGH